VRREQRELVWTQDMVDIPSDECRNYNMYHDLTYVFPFRFPITGVGQQSSSSIHVKDQCYVSACMNLRSEQRLDPTFSSWMRKRVISAVCPKSCMRSKLWWISESQRINDGCIPGIQDVDPICGMVNRTMVTVSYHLPHNETNTNKTNTTLFLKERPMIVWIHRRVRRIMNLRMAVSIANEIGFDVVVVDTFGLSLRQQLQAVACRNISMLASVHGASLGLMAVLPSGAGILEVVGGAFRSTGYTARPYAESGGFRYYQIPVTQTKPNWSSFALARGYNLTAMSDDHKEKILRRASSQADTYRWEHTHDIYLDEQVLFRSLVQFYSVLRISVME
jgi:Glycosyltransferase 61